MIKGLYLCNDKSKITGIQIHQNKWIPIPPNSCIINFNKYLYQYFIINVNCISNLNQTNNISYIWLLKLNQILTLNKFCFWWLYIPIPLAAQIFLSSFLNTCLYIARARSWCLFSWKRRRFLNKDWNLTSLYIIILCS